MFQTKLVERNQNTRFVFSKLFFSENRAVRENMWENIAERRRPHDNMAHGHCVLDTNTHTQVM